MGRTVHAFALALALVLTVARAEATDTDGYALSDFQLNTAADLVDICTLDGNHSHYPEAHGFCLGYFAGGEDYHRAITEGPDFPPIVCPQPGVTRDQAVDVFVAYMRANPQHLQEPPMEAVFRAISAKWPCTK